MGGSRNKRLLVAGIGLGVILLGAGVVVPLGRGPAGRWHAGSAGEIVAPAGGQGSASRAIPGSGGAVGTWEGAPQYPVRAHELGEAHPAF